MTPFPTIVQYYSATLTPHSSACMTQSKIPFFRCMLAKQFHVVPRMWISYTFALDLLTSSTYLIWVFFFGIFFCASLIIALYQRQL